MERAGPGLAERLSLISNEDALAVGARVEDLVDPDVRAVVIRADHPELDRALCEGKEELIVDGEPMSIRLHLTMHQVLANQLADDDPPRCTRPRSSCSPRAMSAARCCICFAAPIAELIHACLQGGTG
jgi:hypothetical protein